MPRQITAFSNETVKRARALREKKHRKEQGLFLAEGLRIITEAADSGHLPDTLFYTGSVVEHPLVQRLVRATETAGGDVIETTADILQKLSGKDNSQSVVGVYSERWTPLDAVDRGRSDIWIVAQALRDPGNLGTILRTGDAIGAGGLILVDDCVDPFSVEAVRASMGALFTQSIIRSDWAAFLFWLRSSEGELIATSLRAEKDYQAHKYRKPAFILVGNESRGLPADYENAADICVKIPMHGKADSLNAAVATAIVAYEVFNQHRHDQ